jgi:hypothetical protein
MTEAVTNTDLYNFQNDMDAKLTEVIKLLQDQNRILYQILASNATVINLPDDLIRRYRR